MLATRLRIVGTTSQVVLQHQTSNVCVRSPVELVDLELYYYYYLDAGQCSEPLSCSSEYHKVLFVTAISCIKKNFKIG